MVRLNGPSRPGPQAGRPWVWIQAKSCACSSTRFLAIGMMAKRYISLSSSPRSKLRSISGIIPSADQRGSLAAASRKSRKAMALVVCEGPVGTMTGLRVRRGAVLGGVADGAGLGDAREAHGLLGEAHRELAAFLPGDAEGAVAAGAGEEVAEDPRQHVEDRVGDAEVFLGAERAVLEALLLGAGAELGAAGGLDVAADLLRQGAERLVPDVDAADAAEDEEDGRRCGRPCTRVRRRAWPWLFPSEGLEVLDEGALVGGRERGAPEVAGVAVAAAGAGVAGAVHGRARRPGRGRRRRRG